MEKNKKIKEVKARREFMEDLAAAVLVVLTYMATGLIAGASAGITLGYVLLKFM